MNTKKRWSTKKASLHDRFFLKVNIPKESLEACWDWTGRKNRDGYGFICESDRNSSVLSAHRVSWEMWNNKKIPEGMCVLHSCDNPGCVNPNHLRIGTQRDNVKDMDSKNRRNNGVRLGEHNNCSKLSTNDVLEIRRIRKEKNLFHREIAEIFNVSRTTITLILNGKNWSHI